jgi:hypothetical protein
MLIFYRKNQNQSLEKLKQKYHENPPHTDPQNVSQKSTAQTVRHLGSILVFGPLDYTLFYWKTKKSFYIQ